MSNHPDNGKEEIMTLAHERTVDSLHKRLVVVELVVFVSLVLNVVQGYYTIHTHNQMTQVQQQTGQR